MNTILSYNVSHSPNLTPSGKKFLALMLPHLHLAVNDRNMDFFEKCKESILATGFSPAIRKSPHYKHADKLFADFEGKRVAIDRAKIYSTIGEITTLLYCHIAHVFDAKTQAKRDHYGSALVPIGSFLALLIAFAGDEPDTQEAA